MPKGVGGFLVGVGNNRLKPISSRPARLVKWRGIKQLKEDYSRLLVIALLNGQFKGRGKGALSDNLASCGWRRIQLSSQLLHKCALLLVLFPTLERRYQKPLES